MIGIKKAMSDVASDADQLQVAIMQFHRASHAVKTSQVGQRLLDRAQNLEALWRWQRECAKMRDELKGGLNHVLVNEARLDGAPPPTNVEAARPPTAPGTFAEPSITGTSSTHNEDPPHSLDALIELRQKAEKFGEEIEFEMAEVGEVIIRLGLANDEWKARRQVDLAAADPQENEKTLTQALNVAATKGVDVRIIQAGRDLVKRWQVTGAKNLNHDELYTATAELRRHIEHREKPGAGSDEQRRVRRAIVGSGLPGTDELVREATKLLRHWEGDNLALRSEARLQNAVRRARLGYKSDAPEAGDLLGSAIAEVSQQGVEARYLEDARDALAAWQASRLKRARSDLQTAIEYRDQDFLKEAIVVAQKAGVERPLLAEATRCLRKLQMEDEINKLLEGAMEASEMENLEVAVRRAHHFEFLEAENPMLRSGSLQVHLRFYAQEFKSSLRQNNYIGLKADVDRAKEIIKKTEVALPTLQENGVPEVAFRTLERDLRGLKLVMPKATDCAICQCAEEELRRVLGAVERYAADLPEVILEGESAVPKGLDRELVTQAQQYLKEYTQAVDCLTSQIQSFGKNSEEEKTPAGDFKSGLVKARLAGAPTELLDQASKLMDESYPEMWAHTKLELELLVALREADDIEELPAEGRFMRVQNAADECRNMKGMELDQVILDEVDEISIALAAERTLAVEIDQAEGILSGRIPSDPTSVSANIDKLKRACNSCDASAQDEAKRTLLPRAEYLIERLEKEATERQDLAIEVTAAVTGRGTSKTDLRAIIIKGRQGFLPEEMLLEAYAKLRKKKIEFLPSSFRTALQTNKPALCAGLWQRGVALRMHEERNGADWKLGSFEKVSGGHKLENLAMVVEGTFTQDRSGGSFGTARWRQNPCWVIRRKDGVAFDSNTKVTVSVAEAGEYPATLSVHVVRNSEHAAASGLGTVLVTGFEVLAGSTVNDDVPLASFSLPEHDEARPVFIVPSAALGEYGPFSLLVDSSDPVEVVEVKTAPRAVWRSEQIIELEWKRERPFSVAMGGGRTMKAAPMMSWYRNPQFRICLKRTKKLARRASTMTQPSGEITIDSALAAAAGGAGGPGPEGCEIPVDEEEAERLGRIFGECDIMGDGDITKRELIKAIKRNGDIASFFNLPRKFRKDDGSMDMLDEKFKNIDKDDDGRIVWEEFVSFYAVHCKPRTSDIDDATTNTLGMIFGKCDKDGSGKITKKELVKACLRDADIARFFGCKNVTADAEGRRRLEEVFVAMDKDGGNELTWDELVQFYRDNIKARTDDLAPAVLDMLNNIFKACAEGGDGHIGKKELMSACLGDEEIVEFFCLPAGLDRESFCGVMEKKFQDLDSDADRDFDWDEFVKFYRANYVENNKPPDLDLDQQAMLGKIFGICDVSGDGSINKRELIKTLRKDKEVARFFGLPAKIRQEDGSREMMETLFQTLDADNDREITWDELVAWYAEASVKVQDRWDDEEEFPGGGGPVMGALTEKDEAAAPPPSKVPMLFARLVPADGSIPVPCAVHIVRNRPGNELPGGRIAENPLLHDVIANSLFNGHEYGVESEVGAVCMLSTEEDGDVIVIPSLESKTMEGKFTLQLRSTEEIVVKRVS